MNDATYSRIVSFFWGIADDCLRDLYVRSKYCDLIPPMTVIRRLDAVLVSTKQNVLQTKGLLDSAGVVNQDGALREAFYNMSRFTLADLKNHGSQGALKADFEAYLDGFSPNVLEILENFEFRAQIPKLSNADVGTLTEKFLDPSINLSPIPVTNGDGTIRHRPRQSRDRHDLRGAPQVQRGGRRALDVKLMARLVLLPVADQIESGTYPLYVGACGAGGVLTVGEERLKDLANKQALGRGILARRHRAVQAVQRQPELQALVVRHGVQRDPPRTGGRVIHGGRRHDT